MQNQKIAICFFGITRSLSRTMSSIETNILKPAERLGETKTYGHFFSLARIDNPRTQEQTVLDPDEYKLLNADWISFTKPGSILEECGFDKLKSYGDFWQDDFKSLSNLVHQLYSLKAVATQAKTDEPDIFVFCRPDLLYHDSFEKDLVKALGKQKEYVALPRWQRHKGGFNDRFAICTSLQAAEAYAFRLEQALNFCDVFSRPLHAEQLLRFALHTKKVATTRLGVRASRMRSTGVLKDEKFRELSMNFLRNDARFGRLLSKL